MASRRLNIARVRGLPVCKRLAKALEDCGFPEKGVFGVIEPVVTHDSISAIIVHRSPQTIRRTDWKARKVDMEESERVVVYPTFFHPAKCIMEIYAGSPNGIDRLQDFLTSCLGLPVAVQHIELDVPKALQRLVSSVERFQLRAVRVLNYSHSSYVEGSLTARLLDTEHGMDFVQEHSESIAGANVRFFASSGRVSLHLRSQACFSYACNEEDDHNVRSILRNLISLS